jgi:uncharacterized membrane protein
MRRHGPRAASVVELDEPQGDHSLDDALGQDRATLRSGRGRPSTIEGRRMDGYEFALFLHIFAAMVWIGGAIAIQVLAIKVVRRDDAVEISRFTSDIEQVGLRLFMPASLVVLAAGAWMVYDGPWKLSNTWVATGLALYALSFITGMGFLGPESGRISKLTAEHGPGHPDVLRRVKRIFLVSRIELVWLLAIVALMVFKPLL